MIEPKTSIYLAVGLIFFITVITGPLFPVIDPTGEREKNKWFGNGSIEIDDVRMGSGEYVLRKGKFGTDSYYLEAPKINTDVSEVENITTLQYYLYIPKLKYKTIGMTLLNNEEHGVYETSIKSPGLSSEEVNQSEFDARIWLKVNEGNQTRTVFEKNVTISVENDD
ncbi:MAG: hypothetical protein ABEK59_08575 [Halobacteria archaeon]